MSQQHMPYISVDSCITDYLGEGEYSQHKYFKCWHIAFRGMENLGLDFFYRIQSLKLPINSNFTVTLPANCLNVTKVGILNDNGAIIPLWNNPNMTTYADLLPDRIDKTTDNESLWLTWDNNTWCNTWNGSGYSNVYGVPSGEPFVGEFKVDIENGVILLSQHFNRNYLMVECLVSPMEGQEYYLPMQFREALIAWIWWKDNKAVSVRRGQVGISRDLKHDFFVERTNAISRWKPSTIMDKYQVSQEQSRAAIKT
ncbi:MAG: hypothetical protein V4538_15250 [Bacteroidota bacterium]